MQKYILTIALAICTFSLFAQTGNSNHMLVRHDTTILKAAECAWIVKSLSKNDPALTDRIGKPVSLIILEAIEKGRLKAIDPETNKPIPPKEIFTWKMNADTVPEYDMEGNIIKYHVIKRLHTPENLDRLRIYQDWYFDISTGRINPVIKWIELMNAIHTHDGTFLGYAVLCRIYY